MRTVPITNAASSFVMLTDSRTVVGERERERSRRSRLHSPHKITAQRATDEPSQLEQAQPSPVSLPRTPPINVG